MAPRKSRKQPSERVAARARPRAPRKARPQRPPPPTLQQELALLARDGAHALRQMLIVVLVIGAIAGAAFGVWSIRPTPAYSSEGLVVGSPFDVTFKVQNESPWFPLTNLGISCIVDHIRASGLPPTLVEAVDVRFPVRGVPTLEPGETATFTCPYRALIGHRINADPDIVRRSEIHFRAEYEVPFLKSVRMTDNSAHLSFDTRVLPPRWVPVEGGSARP
jgi:hypothetical protein